MLLNGSVSQNSVQAQKHVLLFTNTDWVITDSTGLAHSGAVEQTNATCPFVYLFLPISSAEITRSRRFSQCHLSVRLSLPPHILG